MLFGLGRHLQRSCAATTAWTDRHFARIIQAARQEQPFDLDRCLPQLGQRRNVADVTFEVGSPGCQNPEEICFPGSIGGGDKV